MNISSSYDTVHVVWITYVTPLVLCFLVMFGDLFEWFHLSEDGTHNAVIIIEAGRRNWKCNKSIYLVWTIIELIDVVMLFLYTVNLYILAYFLKPCPRVCPWFPTTMRVISQRSTVSQFGRVTTRWFRLSSKRFEIILLKLKPESRKNDANFDDSMPSFLLCLRLFKKVNRKRNWNKGVKKRKARIRASTCRKVGELLCVQLRLVGIVS